jgi:hypothetical protein
LGQFGLLKQTVESACEAIDEEQPKEWGDGLRVQEATRDMKKCLNYTKNG